MILVLIGVTKILFSTGRSYDGEELFSFVFNYDVASLNDIYYRSIRSMKRARDVREQLIGLMQRVEMELVSGITETVNIRKVRDFVN